MKWLVILLIIAVVWIISLYGDVQKFESQFRASEYLYDNCSNRLVDYQDALWEANGNIEDAQSYAWSSYYDMGYALDNLQTVDEP